MLQIWIAVGLAALWIQNFLMVFLQKPPQISNGTLPGIPSLHLGTAGSFVASLCRSLSPSVSLCGWVVNNAERLSDLWALEAPRKASLGRQGRRGPSSAQYRRMMVNGCASSKQAGRNPPPPLHYPNPHLLLPTVFH